MLSMVRQRLSLPMKIMAKPIVLTSIILFCTILFFEVSDLDVWLQDYFFDFEQQRWILGGEHKITRFIFYDGIKKLFIAFVLLILTGLLFFRKNRLIQAYQHELLIVCLSAIMVPVAVGALKLTTNMPCPRDILRYGGHNPNVTLLTEYPTYFHQTEKIECYPAGHASAGFALLSLIFLFKRRRNKVLAVVAVMLLGWGMGGYKMLIGDHFLSHTVVTMILAWLIILIIARSVYYFRDKHNVSGVA